MPSFNTGDLVFDFTISPGVATVQQWDGEKLIKLGFSSLSGNLPQVFNEVPGGNLDGANTVFTTSATFIALTTRVYLNGVRLILNADYTETDVNQITFTQPPLPTDSLFIDYNKG